MDRDGQDDELVARLLPPLCSCAGRRFCKLVRIHMQIRDVAGGVGKDDLDVGWIDCGIFFGYGYTGEEIGFDAVCETSIPL